MVLLFGRYGSHQMAAASGRVRSKVSALLCWHAYQVAVQLAYGVIAGIIELDGMDHAEAEAIGDESDLDPSCQWTEELACSCQRETSAVPNKSTLWSIVYAKLCDAQFAVRVNWCLLM
jgi:hypothetical protein